MNLVIPFSISLILDLPACSVPKGLKNVLLLFYTLFDIAIDKFSDRFGFP
jgi:hypothetical protein